MSDSSLDSAAAWVLDRYPVPLTAGNRRSLGNHGGFSGARLWRIDGDAGPLCLRAWPMDERPEHLALIHSAMTTARTAGLPFVPGVCSTCDGATLMAHAGRLWDLTEWLPGRADFHERPSVPRLTAACAALARLHAVWARSGTQVGPYPAVQRRLDRAAEWLTLLRAGWRPRFDRLDDPVRPWAERAWQALHGRIECIPARLASWQVRPLPLQLCLCDIWHAHVLYQDEAVSGMIDYGSVKLDHVSVDLARLLGSLIGVDAEQRAIGLAAYRRVRSLTPEEEELVILLDETGTLLAAANWLRWLYQEPIRHFDDREAVAVRLAELVERL